MQKITPFLWFDRNCEEAINFYVSVFEGAPDKKGESKVENIKYYPAGITEGPMAGFDGKILTAVFKLAGQTFMALDGGSYFKPSGAVSFLVECDTQEEIDHYWSKLTEGGDPNAQQCGWLKDKYGFSWQIVPDMSRWMNDKDKERSDRAMQAMLQMKKIDIATLEEAYNMI
jgi:predicted 3-demethylubiquinone-9 3-methyltransferase (glyoxalase superfamily)